MKLHWSGRLTPVFSARLSVALCIFFAAIGIVLGKVEDSLAVQTNGLIAAIDIVNSLLFLSAVRQGLRSPDFSYNYGYGKYESLAIIVSSALLILVLGITLFEGFISFGSNNPVQNHALLLVYSTLSFFMMQAMSRLQRRFAGVYQMPMLNFDADVWRIDSYIEIGVIVNLILGAIFKANHLEQYGRILDSLTAILLLLLALKVPLSHSKTAFWQLLDKTLAEEAQLDILSVIAENIHEICEFKALHTRQSGKDIFVEIDVVLPFDYSLEEAFSVEEKIQRGVKQKFSNAIVRLYAIPCAHECLSDGCRYCPVLLHKNSPPKGT